MARTKRWTAIICWATGVLFLIAPMSVWVYINRVEYLALAQSTSMALGFIIAVLFVGLLIFKVMKDLDKRFAGVVWLVFLTALAFFFEPIIDDIKWMLVCVLISYIGFTVLDKIAHSAWDYVKEYSKEKVRVEARKEAEESTTPLALHM